jgi:hypothetical protein
MHDMPTPERPVSWEWNVLAVLYKGNSQAPAMRKKACQNKRERDRLSFTGQSNYKRAACSPIVKRFISPVRKILE